MTQTTVSQLIIKSQEVILLYSSVIIIQIFVSTCTLLFLGPMGLFLDGRVRKTLNILGSKPSRLEKESFPNLLGFYLTFWPFSKLDFSNIYSLHTVKRCNKHIYYNHPIFHKKPPGKTSFFVAEEKSTEGQNMKTPQLHHAGSTPTQSSPPGRWGIIASTPSPYSNC